MKTLYAACLSRLGLSQTEAASLHSVRLDTVKSWSSGRNTPPPGAFDDLREYEAGIVSDAEALFEQAEPEQIEIDDSEAGRRALMVAADFVLNSSAPVVVGRSTAARIARMARKQG